MLMLGVSGHVNMLGVSGHVNMLGGSGHVNMFGVSGHVNMLGVSGHVNMLGVSGHVNMLGVSILSRSTIFLLDGGIVQTVLYCLYWILIIIAFCYTTFSISN